MEEKSIYRIMEERREAERLARERETLRSIHKNEEYWAKFYDSRQPESQSCQDIGNGYLRLPGGAIVRTGTKRVGYEAEDARELIREIDKETRKRL